MADDRSKTRQRAKEAEAYLADWKQRKSGLSRSERRDERSQVQDARAQVQAHADERQGRQQGLKTNAQGVAMLDKPGFSIALNKQGQLASRDDAYYGKGERAEVRAINGITATQRDRERINKFLDKNEGYSLTPGEGRTVVRSMTIEQKGQQFMGPGYHNGLGGRDVERGLATVNVYGPAATAAPERKGKQPKRDKGGGEGKGGGEAAPSFDPGKYAPAPPAGGGGDNPGDSGGSFQPGWYGEGHISDHLPTGGFASTGIQEYEYQQERGDYKARIYEEWKRNSSQPSGAQMTGAASTPSSYGAAVDAFKSQSTPLEAANAASDSRFAASEGFQNDLIRRLTQAPFGSATV